MQQPHAAVRLAAVSPAPIPSRGCVPSSLRVGISARRGALGLLAVLLNGHGRAKRIASSIRPPATGGPAPAATHCSLRVRARARESQVSRITQDDDGSAAGPRAREARRTWLEQYKINKIKKKEKKREGGEAERKASLPAAGSTRASGYNE